MPERDGTDAGQNDRGLTVTRRAAVAGLAATMLAQSPAFAAPVAPFRIGVVAGLGLDAVTRARWGRPATIVPFAAWGCLADHAAATGPGLIDAAVLPAEETEPALATPPRLSAVLLRRVAAARRIGIALRPPGGATALRCLAAAPDGVLVVLPPAMLRPNLATGAIDAALVLGEDPLGTSDIPAGTEAVPLGPAAVETLLPRLALRLCPATRAGGALT